MKRWTTRLWALALTLALGIGMCAPALAYESADAERKAEALQEMGLFRGTGTGFALDAAPTRLQSLIMLVRLTGGERAALLEQHAHPFTDVAEGEASAYVGYAVEKGLTRGVSAQRFVPGAKVSAQAYATMVLRALGYQDGSQTVYSQWETLGKKAGILPAGVSTRDFRRGDLVLMSYAALGAAMHSGSGTLADALVSAGAVSEVALSAGRATAGEKVTLSDSLTEILGAVYAGVEGISPSGLNVTKITEENLSFFLGVKSLDFTEGVACEPMMSSQAHSVCLVRLKDGADTAQVKRDIAAGVNPNKWICVGVDPANIRVESIGNLVLLVMDNTAADQYTANFKKLSAAGLIQTGGTYVDAVQAADPSSIRGFSDKLTALRSAYFPENRVFCATVPHKSYYARTELPVYLDHALISDSLSRQLPGWTCVELADTLTLADYYRTDAHWRQETLFPAAEKLGTAMHFTVDRSAFTALSRDGFVGAYRTLDASLESETVRWLTSPATGSAQVQDVQHPAFHGVYALSALDTASPYDLFLSGPTPLTVITNPAAPQRELVVFRDSYASSLVPLLLDAYSKITLVDLRYMSSSLLPQYVEFGGADVLCLFSDQVVNNSRLLK
ncbi:MAG: hypothetical protein LKJ80_03375 [Oscillibacter sp.]|jgi:hypothetical protein|nr:hypothetical protein [Oscillibacter sp.]